MVSRHDVDEPAVKEAFWDTLRRDPADPRDIARAYWRFTRASASRRTPFALGRWLVVGFVAGAGVVSAATVARHVVARWTTVIAREGSKPSLSPAPRARRVPHRRGAGPVIAEVPSVAARDVPPSGALPEAMPAETPRSPAPPPAAQPPAALPSAALRVGATSPSDERSPSVDPQWRRVSEALRANDYAGAEAALHDLETHGSASDRESASLSLAQILLSRGRVAEARPRLERLGATARSSLVREKARAMLDSRRPSPDRSTSVAPDTN